VLGSQVRSFIIFGRDRHEITQHACSGRSAEDGFEHVGVRQVAALRTELAERPHKEPPTVLRVQYGSEDGRTIETG
jgi:hypothetical protein